MENIIYSLTAISLIFITVGIGGLIVSAILKRREEKKEETNNETDWG